MRLIVVSLTPAQWQRIIDDLPASQHVCARNERRDSLPYEAESEGGARCLSGQFSDAERPFRYCKSFSFREVKTNRRPASILRPRRRRFAGRSGLDTCWSILISPKRRRLSKTTCVNAQPVAPQQGLEASCQRESRNGSLTRGSRASTIVCISGFGSLPKRIACTPAAAGVADKNTALDERQNVAERRIRRTFCEFGILG